MASQGTFADLLRPEVVAAVDRLDLRARAIVAAYLAGRHRSPFRGFSLEFSEHRRYVAGDEVRRIDWKLVARTDRVHVKQFEAETARSALILLDASASMGIEPPPGAIAKSFYAKTLAAAFAHLLVRQRDPAGLLVFGSDVREFLPPRATRPHLEAIFATLHGAVPTGRSHLERAAEGACRRFSRRGLVVLISDLLGEGEDDARAAFSRIAAAGHDLIVIHLLDAQEARFPFEGTLRFQDPETGEERWTDAGSVRDAYLQALSKLREGLRRAAAEVAADLVPCDTATPFDQAIDAVARVRRTARGGRP